MAIVLIQILFLTALFPSASQALLPCPKTKSQFSDIKHLATFFKEVDGETNKRYGFDEFAKAKGKTLAEVKQEFSGSGRIQCGDKTLGSAFLAGRADLLVTSGHLFYEANCQKVDLSSCTYTPLFQKKSYKIKVSTAKVTYDLANCRGETVNNQDDWAVVELLESVKGAKPYKIPVRPADMRIKDQILQVSALARNFGDRRTPYIAECEVFDTDVQSAQFSDMKFPVATNCATSNGSSGSVQLVPDARNGEYEILGLVSSGNKKAKDGETVSLRHGRFSGTTPLTGEFFDHLVSMSGENR